VGCYDPTAAPGEGPVASDGGESSTTTHEAPNDPSLTSSSTAAVSSSEDDADDASTGAASTADAEATTVDASTGPWDPCTGLVCGSIEGQSCGSCPSGDCVANLTCCSAATVLGSFDTAGTAVGIDVVGSEAYVADFDGLRVLGVANPDAIVDRGLLTEGSYAWDVQVLDARAYVAWAYAGLVVLDVDDAGMPTPLGSEPDAVGTGVAVAGALAYVAGGGSQQFHVVDIADPAAPQLIGTLPLAGQALRVALGDGYAYVPVEGDGLRVVDIADPTLPVDVGVFETEGYARGVVVVDDVAWLSVAYEGFVAVDVSVAHAPVELGRIAIDDVSGTLDGVAVAGRIAAVAHGNTGVELLDVSEPLYPLYIATVPVPDARDVVIVDGLLYVAAGDDGISVVALPECSP
jgi:hypothetical protein